MRDQRILCVYGTVTGKAESIAQQIALTAECKGVQIDLYSFESLGKCWNIDTLDHLIIVSSTTGDGEQPEAVIPFWRKLRKKTLPDNHLSHVNFTILGLGDTNYNQFCNAPKNLRRRLKELGGKEFYPPGWADDGTGLELVVEPWIDGLLTALSGEAKISEPEIQAATIQKTVEEKPDSAESSLAFSETLRSIALDVPTCPARFLKIDYSEGEGEIAPLGEPPTKLPLQAGHLQRARLVSNTRLSAVDAVKTYMDIKLQSAQAFDYTPGDTIGVICENNEADILGLCKQIEMERPLSIICKVYLDPETKKARAKLPEHIPTIGPLRSLLFSCIDVRSVPKKLFIRSLVDYTCDIKEKRRLEELCSKQGSGEYTRFVREDQVGLVKLLQVFPSCKPPLSLLLEHLPRLNPRPYSLSSSPTCPRNQIRFTYTVVESPRPGLATSYLKNLKPGAEVLLYPRTSSGFHPPTDPSASLIMIGAGSGIGPFMGFLEHRRALGIKTGSALLLFGCRDRNKDFLHQAELEQFKRDKVLTELFVSFSREQNEVKYVQDLLLENATELTRLIVEDGAHVYVCGDAKNMGKGVHDKLTSMLSSNGLDGAELLKKMTLEGKYKQDLWT